MSVFDPSSFDNPPNVYRPLQIVHGMDHALLDPEQLTGEVGIDRRLEHLRAMGIGGIVVNVGFRDYLVGSRQWEIYRYALRKAADLGLELWLYDERGYPSGTAGGIVTRAHPEWQALGLACYTKELQGPAEVRFDLPVSCKHFVWAGALADPKSATRGDALDLSAQVDGWGTLRWSAPAGRWTLVYLAQRYMYEGTHSSLNVSDSKRYINQLLPEAVGEFLRVTHERYVRETPPELWAKIRAIFTDEPSLMTAYMPTPRDPNRGKPQMPGSDAFIFTDRPPAVPWVEDLLERFVAAKGYDLRPHLFELFMSASDEASYVRHDYYDLITRLVSTAWYEQVLRWCQAHGVASSGHVLFEEFVPDNVAYNGSFFAVVRQMDLPGLDMLSSRPQFILDTEWFIAAKNASSVAHLTGRPVVHSETSTHIERNADPPIPVTNAERRGTGNLQYVLGVNQITSYYGWQEFGEQGYWEYNDYMGRLASLLTGGSHRCDVAVLYPIRSAWAEYLPSSQAPHWEARRDGWSEWSKRIDQGNACLLRHLLRHQVDMDVIDEEAVVSGEMRAGALHVRDEAYRAIILPPLRALALETVRALAAFARARGVLLSIGPLPDLAEMPQNTSALRQEIRALFGGDGPARLVELEEIVPVLRERLGADLRLDGHNPNILYTHRDLEGRELYFVVNNAPERAGVRLVLRVPGPYTLYRPLTGEVSPLGEQADFALEAYEGAFVVCQ